MFPGLQPGGTSRRHSSSGIPPPVELEAAVAILCQDKRNDVVRPKRLDHHSSAAQREQLEDRSAMA